MKNEKNDKKEMNLAYGGQALIEGVLMRSQEGYAFTVRKPDKTLHKEYHPCVSLGKKIKFLGLPFIRGIAGFCENLYFGMKIINRSAEIAFPEETTSDSGEKKESSTFAMILTYVLAFGLAMLLFVATPYFITSLFKLDHTKSPFVYNLVAGIIRMFFFFIYLFLISFLEDTKRLFGYHGAEHKTINTYEAGKELSVENVRESSRLHPRCGTSFIFIVFLITIVIFPFFNIFFNQFDWYLNAHRSLQKLIIIVSHIIIGMPIVSSISYELLKLSAKYEKNPIVKLFVLPGLFFQLFSTREPDDSMIETAISSLQMVINKGENPDE